MDQMRNIPWKVWLKLAQWLRIRCCLRENTDYRWETATHPNSRPLSTWCSAAARTYTACDPDQWMITNGNILSKSDETWDKMFASSMCTRFSNLKLETLFYRINVTWKIMKVNILTKLQIWVKWDSCSVHRVFHQSVQVNMTKQLMYMKDH